MSVAVMHAVWKHSQSKGSDRLVLLAISDHAHDDGTGAYPGQRLLADKTRLTERAIRDCIKRLEALGELAVERLGNHRTHRYTVILPGIDRPEESSGGDRKPAAGGDRKPAAALLKPSVEPSVEQELATAPPSRPRDPVFDALALLEDMDPTRPLPRGAGARIGKVQREIVGHTPDVTRDEIARRRRNWNAVFGTKDPAVFSIEGLAKWWTRLDDPTGAKAREQASREDDGRRRAAVAAEPPGIPLSEMRDRALRFLDGRGVPHPTNLSALAAVRVARKNGWNPAEARAAG